MGSIQSSVLDAERVKPDTGAFRVTERVSVKFRAPTMPYRLRLEGPTGILRPPNPVTIEAVSLRLAPAPNSGLEGSLNVSPVPTRVQIRSSPPMNVSFWAMI